MAKVRRKVVIEHDPDPDFSWLDQWDTPEKYAKDGIVIACPDHPYAQVRGRKRPICRQCRRHARPMSWSTYRETIGDPERHVSLMMLTYELGPADEDWRLVDSLGNIDFFEQSADWQTGTFYALNQLPAGDLRDLARDAKLPVCLPARW